MNNKIDPNWFKQKKGNESQTHNHGHALAKESYLSRSPQVVSCFLAYLAYALYFWINTEYKWNFPSGRSEWRTEVIVTNIYFTFILPLVVSIFLINKKNLNRSIKIFCAWILLFILFRYASESFAHPAFHFLRREWFIVFFIGCSIFYFITISLEFIKIPNIQKVNVSNKIYWLFPMFNIILVNQFTSEYSNEIYNDLPLFIAIGFVIPLMAYLFYKLQKDRFLYKWTLIAWSFTCLLGVYYRNTFFDDLHFGYFATVLFIPLFIYIIRVDAKKFN